MKNKAMELKKLIEAANTIYLTSHISPDADSIGSLLGLYITLKSSYKSKNIKAVLKDKVPEKFNFLKIEDIKQLESYDKGDLLILLDCADKGRIGITGLENVDNIVNIDHHISNPDYGDLNIVEVEASSTSEIIFEILDYMDLLKDIDIDVYRAIYTGISADTGSFKYSNTTSKTHSIISKILEEDIDMNQINVSLYQNKSLEDIEVLKKILESISFQENNRIASIVFMEKDYENIENKDSMDGIVEFARDIEGVEASFFLKEEGVFVKGSLRSKNHIDVSEVAKEFGGGGHAKASGFKIEGNIEDIKEKIIKNIKSRL